jgi:hypothetical protein
MADLQFLQTVKRLAIKAMFSDDDLLDQLVLKGGNLLDVVYGISSRPSVDIDFSTSGEFELPVLKQKVSEVLKSTFIENGFIAFDITVEEKPRRLTEDLKDFWGGYQIYFKLIDNKTFGDLKDDVGKIRKLAQPIGKKDSTKFEIQISKFEYCEPKEARDLDGYRIYVYPPALFVCEKIRAICQQHADYKAIVRNHPSSRARDFVDICIVVDHFNVSVDDTFREMIANVFSAKRVPLELIGRVSEMRDFHADSFPAVRATIKAGEVLMEFDHYFQRVLEICRALKPLWNE